MGKDGKLKLANGEWRKFRKGDQLEGLVLDSVDVEAEQISLELAYGLPEDPEQDPPVKPEAKPKAARPKRPAPTQIETAKVASARSGGTGTMPVAARSKGAASGQREAL